MMEYENIKNERLRQLVMGSVSIQSLKEDRIQAMVERIALLPEGGQNELIAVLEDEQKQVEMAKKLTALSSEEKLLALQKDGQKIDRVDRQFDTDVRIIREDRDRHSNEVAAENLLQQL